MSRYRGPRLRIIRRLGPLPGFTRKTATKEAPPGQRSGAEESKKKFSIRNSTPGKAKITIQLWNYGITTDSIC